MQSSRTPRRRWRVGALVVLGGLLAACGGGVDPAQLAAGDAAAGQPVFQDNCATCHGEDLHGTSMGPPLVHEYYVPSKVSNDDMAAAISGGLDETRWHFGPMPAWPSLSGDEIADLIAYVRQQQRAAGLGGS